MTQEPGFDGAERRQGVDRRSDIDRRDTVDRRKRLDRRRGPGRRRSDLRRSAEEGEMNEELLEFIMAIDDYKRANERPFPSWSEVFEIVHYLGYRKVASQGEHINQVTAE